MFFWWVLLFLFKWAFEKTGVFFLQQPCRELWSILKPTIATALAVAHRGNLHLIIIDQDFDSNKVVKLLDASADKLSLAEDFASGYYFGEVLHKFQLQDDFAKFSKSNTADSKLNNFTRLEPTLHLLEVIVCNLLFILFTSILLVAEHAVYILFIFKND